MNWVKKNKVALSILIVGCIMVGIGLFRCEEMDLYQKAIMVCLECIGIG